MAVMEKENKMGFGALVKLRSLETYVKRLKPAIKKDAVPGRMRNVIRGKFLGEGCRS